MGGARWEGLMPYVCTSWQPWLKLCLESHPADAPSRCIKDLPSDLPKECLTKMHNNAAIKMSRRDNFMGRGMGQTGYLRIYTQAVTQIGLQDR